MSAMFAEPTQKLAVADAPDTEQTRAPKAAVRGGAKISANPSAMKRQQWKHGVN